MTEKETGNAQTSACVDVLPRCWPQLASEEFSQFLKQNGVKFTRVPPYHPASNGAAERSVQTAKTFLTKQVLEGKAN